MRILDGNVRARQKKANVPVIEWIKTNRYSVLWSGISVKTTNSEDCKKLIEALAEMGIECTNSADPMSALQYQINFFHIGGSKLTRGKAIFNIEGI